MGCHELEIHLQQPRRVLEIDLLQYRVGQPDSIDSPSALGGNPGWRIVEILVLRFEETIIDLIKFIKSTKSTCKNKTFNSLINLCYKFGFVMSLK